MSRNRPTRRALVVWTGVAAVAAVVWALVEVPAGAAGDEPPAELTGDHPAELTGTNRDRVADPFAHAEGVQVATSVCEAQRLKAAKAKHPTLEISIPEEFDRDFPSLDACRSHAAAWADDAEGPKQPIPFSHAHHAGKFQIDCLYCHTGTDRAPSAGMPSVELCMGCHANFPKEYDELEGIRILKQHWNDKTSIPWEQIHRLPEYVQFRHNRHIKAGFDCNTCHGSASEPVQSVDRLRLVPDTKWWVYGLPTQKLEMGWCVKCHRQNGASQDCLTCHY